MAATLLCGLAGATAPAAEAVPEIEIKAALLYHFAEFLEWPPAVLPTADTPIVIGILGEDPFGPKLDELVSSSIVNGRRLVVERYGHDVNAALRSHILFISASEQRELPAILRKLRHHPILTVADCDGFLRSGGMVRLHRSPEQRVRIRVNLVAVRAASLTMSAKLLRVAEPVSVDED